MTKEALQKMIKSIVSQAKELKDKHIEGDNSIVNYAAIFSQDNNEYEDLIEVIKEIGEVILDTKTGPLFKITPLDTVAGSLKLVKIRKPDKSRPERGDADFTVDDYDKFKKEFLDKEGFRLIEREDFEMIELMDSGFNVRAYFSNPPLDEQLKV